MELTNLLSLSNVLEIHGEGDISMPESSAISLTRFIRTNELVIPFFEDN